ncbi:hypothetical protein QT972_03670 [Microcoleus sp. herbarium7]
MPQLAEKLASGKMTRRSGNLKSGSIRINTIGDRGTAFAPCPPFRSEPFAPTAHRSSSFFPLPDIRYIRYISYLHPLPNFLLPSDKHHKLKRSESLSLKVSVTDL